MDKNKFQKDKEYELKSAVRYYWDLCEELYNKIDPAEYWYPYTYFEKMLTYKRHLLSCCLRMVPLLETPQPGSSVYDALKENKYYHPEPEEMAVLISDTVQYCEDPEETIPSLRRDCLSREAIGDIHHKLSHLIRDYFTEDYSSIFHNY